MGNILFPDLKVFDGKYFEVHQDWEVPIPAFFILAPKRRMNSIIDFSYDESFEFIKILRMVRISLKEIFDLEHVYFFENEDSSGGFHFWIFPRWDWMESFGRKIESVRPIMNYAKKEFVDEQNLEKVREHALKFKDYLDNKKT